ncbi:Inner membrane protein YohD (plasmid) [Variovorax sp. PBL-E5]|nr:Inner membrane protein YohD [Variovorax sp. PBL-E5]
MFGRESGMYLAHLVSHYGYAAVFAGSLLEGESVLLLAGLAAHRGYLSLIPVVALAFCGGTLGDQILFHLGRRYGAVMLRRSPAMAARIRLVTPLIERHQAALIIGVRFMYGLRLIGPFAIGMTDVSAFRFARLNMLGAALWAPLFTGLGYLFGQTLHWLIADLDRYEGMALLAGVAIAAAVGLVRWLCMRRRRRADGCPRASSS